MSKKHDLALPGTFLTTEEEFMAGNNTYADDEGNVYATSIGKPEFNSTERVVEIQKHGTNVLPLEEGSIVLGYVALVKENSAVISMREAMKDGMRRKIGLSNAAIPIRNVAQGFVKSLDDKFKIGDIVKGRVSMVQKNAVDLRTNEPELGVIMAYCSKCRQPLHLFGKELKCISCGNMEGRKISSDYLLK